MAKFKDARGREWVISLTVADLKKLRELGVELSPGKVDESLGELLYAEPEKLVTVLFHLCESQAAGQGVTPDDFAAGFTGDVLGEAGEAFAEAITDFFPRRKIGRAMAASLRTNLEAIDEKVAKSISSRGVGNSPDSSASTPAS